MAVHQQNLSWKTVARMSEQGASLVVVCHIEDRVFTVYISSTGKGRKSKTGHSSQASLHLGLILAWVSELNYLISWINISKVKLNQSIQQIILNETKR